MSRAPIQLSDHFTCGRLIRFTLPSITMMIFTAIYGVVDGFFVSNYAGKTPFAAVNLIIPVLLGLGCVGFMFGTGGGALIAKTMGQGDRERANDIFSMIVYVSAAIGVVLEGVPAGLELDLEAVQRELDRRKPGQDPTATARRESDTVQVLSGVFEGKTTGAPLAIRIPNSDQHPQDYEAIRCAPRPGHGDYAGFIKSQGCQDYRGGGHFSGRLTAPLVAAGAVAKQALALRGVRVGAHISSIYGITDASLEDAGALEAVAAKPFPVLDDAKGEEMRQAILEAKDEGDSVGGAIECAVTGLPAGLGAPDFGRNVEGIFAQHLFAVPAVKGVDFGAGVAFSLMRGSEANDPFEVKDPIKIDFCTQSCQ